MKNKEQKVSILNKVLISFAIIITCLSSYLAYCAINDIKIPLLDKFVESAKNDDNSKTTDLIGTWKSDEKGTYHEAIITEDNIVINWISPDNKSLYWDGTYTPSKNATNEYSWLSKVNHESTDKALLASRDDTKKFTYKDGVISYEASAMGTTKTIRLKKIQ